MKLGGIYLSVGAKTEKLKRDLAKAKGMTAKTAVLMRQEIGRISFAQVGVTAIAFGATVAFGMKKAIDAASDLQEVQGKFDVVFAKHKEQAEDMANVLVDSYAMSTREAKQYMSSIQDLLVPMGMASDKAIIMSNEVVKLSADLASFNNVPTATAMADIQSALVGNFETMKKYGVVLNETVIKQEALSRGLWDGKGMVDANTKAQIAYQLMLKGSAAAIGDQQRTMGSYANQMKQLKANIEDIAAAVGDELLPQVTAWINQVNISIKQNPEMIKQMGEFAKNVLTLATSMGKVIGFGVEFVNVLSKITGAMGLASTGMISWKTAIFDGAATMELFGTEMGNAQLQAQKLREDLGELESWREFWSNKETLEYAQKSAQLKTIEDRINAIINRNKVMAGVIDYVSDFSGLPVIDKPPPPAKEDLTKRMAAMKRANEEMQRLFVPDYALDFSGMSLDQELEWAAKTIEIAKDVEDQRLEIVAQANQKLAEIGLEKFNLIREQIKQTTDLYRQAGVDEETIKRITAEKIKEIAIEENQYILENTTSLMEGMSVAWENYIANTESAIQRVSELAVSMAQTFASGVGDAYAQAIVYGKSLSESFANLTKKLAAQVISSLVKIGVERLIQWAVAKVLGATEATTRMGILAAETYAGSFAATAAIPIVGPALAPGVAAASTAAMLAGATAAGTTGSAVGVGIASFDQGGISNARGIYQTGDIKEAHIPIPSGGKIPVKVEDRGKTQIILSNPVFQDLETLKQTMAQIAEVVAERVAPDAVVNNYNDDGAVRNMIRGGI